MRKKSAAKVYAEDHVDERPSTPAPSNLALDNAEEMDQTDRAFFNHLMRYHVLLPPLGSNMAPRRRRWSYLLLLLTACECYYLPFCAAFRLPRNKDHIFELPALLTVLQWVIDLLFLVDVAVMFRTTLHADTLATTDVITDTTVIRRRYMQTTFALDVRAQATKAPLHRNISCHLIQRSAHACAGTNYNIATCGCPTRAQVVALLPLEMFAFAIVDESTRARGAFAVLCSHSAVSLRLTRLLQAHRIFSYHGKTILKLTRMRRLFVFWFVFFVIAHWNASLFWVIEPTAFHHLATPIDTTSPPLQQYSSAFYWSLTTLLRVPWVAPETALGRLFTCISTFAGAILFAFFNGEVHAIVRASLGATLARTSNIADLKTLFGKTSTGQLTQQTAIAWSNASASAERLPGDNIKEQGLIKTLPSNIRVELLSGIFQELRRPECGFEGRVSPYAMATIAAQCWPAVFLAKQVIVNAASVTADVYILQTGGLRLSGGVSKGATNTMARSAGSRKSIKPKSRSICVSDSSRTRGQSGSSKHTTKSASAFSLPVQLPGAECSRFRILERPGSLVGSCEMTPSPFIIEAIKLSHVLVLNAPAALKGMAGADAEAVRLAVKRQQTISIDYLTGQKRRTSEEMEARVREELAAGTSGARFVCKPGRQRKSGSGRGSIGAMTFAQVEAMQKKASAEEAAEDALRASKVSALRHVMDGDEAVALELRTQRMRESLRDMHTLMQPQAEKLREAVEAHRKRLGLPLGSVVTGGAGLGLTASTALSATSSSPHDDDDSIDEPFPTAPARAPRDGGAEAYSARAANGPAAADETLVEPIEDDSFVEPTAP